MAINAAHTPGPISSVTINLLCLNMKPPLLKFQYYNFFIANSEVSIKKVLLVLIVNGYAKDVLNKLPMEFAVEAQKIIER
jgi:hypothetical protein